MSDAEYLDQRPPDTTVLALLGEVNYAWAQLDLVSSAAFASLLKLGPVELGITIGRIETQAKIEKMYDISKHRGSQDLSAVLANIRSELKRLRPTRNAVTHGAYMGKSSKNEFFFRLPASFIVAEGEESAQEMFVFTIPELEQHVMDIAKLSASFISKFDVKEMGRMINLRTRVK